MLHLKPPKGVHRYASFQPPIVRSGPPERHDEPQIDEMEPADAARPSARPGAARNENDQKQLQATVPRPGDTE